MKAEQQRWLAEADRLSQAEHFAEAYRLASLVLCEDEKNQDALWLVATTTNSVHVRRWALKTLLLLDPTSPRARQLYNTTNHKAEHSTPVTYCLPCAATDQRDELRV